MPLTELQKWIARSLSPNRSRDSYLAGGAALNMSDDSYRFSNDLDYFQSSGDAANRAASTDCKLLAEAGVQVNVLLERDGFVRALANRGEESTKIEWVHDTSWRFLPLEADPTVGYRLGAIDVAINKLLALVGREEPRDFLDVVEVSETVLPLGGLIWAACGKDPGFTPEMLLGLVRRRGHYRPDDFDDLRLTKPLDLVELKRRWLSAIESARGFLDAVVDQQPGCLFYSTRSKKFVGDEDLWNRDRDAIIEHRGTEGGRDVEG